MHAIVLSLAIAAQGAGFEDSGGYGSAECCDSGCDTGCDTGHCGAGGGRRHFCSLWGCGPMPQTCYAPRYGCYPGNNRFMNRYPAFHGSYYRRPYNYRNLFDYPWHAELHEPTSLFSYNVAAEDDTAGNNGEAFDFGSASTGAGHSFGDHPPGVPIPEAR